MKRYGLRAENLRTWLGLLGIACYVITWFGYSQFYRSFNTSPEAVGISYPALLVPAAVFFSIIVIVLLGIAGLVAPLFMRVPIRSARIHWRVGLLIFVAARILGAKIGPPPETGLAASRVILALTLLFGGILFTYGIAVILLEKVDKYERRRRHLFRVHRLRRRIQPKCSEEEKRVVIREYMDSRRRSRLNRAHAAGDMRGAAPVVLVLLLPIVALLTLSFVVYLAHSAEHAARDVVAGKRMFTSTGDFAAGVLLNVGAWNVEVVAVESRFRPLERQKLLYLGRKDGAYVLYDIAKKKALYIPSGAIALQFSDDRS